MEAALKQQRDREFADRLIDGLFPFLYTSFSLVEAVVEYHRLAPLKYVIKPLVLVILILYLLNKTAKISVSTAQYVTLALIASLFGDIALMFCDHQNEKSDETWFLLGVGFFAISHVFWIISFSTNIRQVQSSAEERNYILNAGPFLIAMLLMIFYLYPNLKMFRVPVIIYAGVLATMGSFAAARYYHTTSWSFWYVLLGAIVFMVSDSLIAFQKFAKWESKFIDPAIILTYFLAQYLIVEGMISHMRKYQRNAVYDQSPKKKRE